MIASSTKVDGTFSPKQGIASMMMKVAVTGCNEDTFPPKQGIASMMKVKIEACNENTFPPECHDDAY